MTQITPDVPVTARRLDPEDAQLALAKVQELLQRHQLVENLVHRQEENDQRADLVEGLLQRQHDAELTALVNDLHPADIAFILSSVPNLERQMIWRLVGAEHDADVLLEVDDWVRESLIEAMDRKDLVAATGNMDADELADLAPDLPADVVAEVQKGLTI
jgi:magnesium transporter